MTTITVDIPQRDVSFFKKIILRLGWTCEEEDYMGKVDKTVGDECTTIMDISEMPFIYNNPNARLTYLHLALKAARDGDNRDRVDISIRKQTEATGCTVSATRHALKVLEDAHLITREGDKWIVNRP